MSKLDIKSLLAKYPRMHIHYHDSGSWWLLKEPPSEEWEYTGESDPFVLASGRDSDAGDYLPLLVSALADALGITSDSI